MFDLPLHPKIVHLPMALAVLMPLVFGGALLSWIRGWLPRQAFGVALALQLALVASGFASLRSGEVDEEVAERVVSHELIHEHEEAGEVFFAAGMAVLLAAGAAVALKREPLARGLAVLAFIGSFVVLGLGVRAGHLGGELAYRHGAASAFREGTTGAPTPSRPSAQMDDD